MFLNFLGNNVSIWLICYSNVGQEINSRYSFSVVRMSDIGLAKMQGGMMFDSLDDSPMFRQQVKEKFNM